MDITVDDVLKLATKYWKRAGGTGLAHYRAAETAERRHLMIGVPNAFFAAIVATSVFSTLSSDTMSGSSSLLFWIRVITGLVALAAAILAGLQAFLNFGDKAEKHHAAGAKYAELRRKIDLFFLKFVALTDAERQAAILEVEEMACILNVLDEESPNLTAGQFRRAEKEYSASGIQ